ncbi:MAG: sigma-70 family RNA polymerase sigma factor, partial [Saprospiraceae bacterium]|nr:sigma-70 family RNA polymerase sigma factor [Saprospiraceae bacterium]
LQQKDRQAIALLYDRYAPTLYGIVLRIVKSRESAEDIIQETFVKAWQNGSNFDTSKGTLFTWLLNIARNTAIDKKRSVYFRQQEKTQAIDGELYNAPSLSEQPNPDLIGLDAMVNGLEEKHRILIELIYFQGFTHTEVTEQLHIPLGTIKTRLRIALRELRKLFEEQNVTLGLMLICNWLMN